MLLLGMQPLIPGVHQKGVRFALCACMYMLLCGMYVNAYLCTSFPPTGSSSCT